MSLQLDPETGRIIYNGREVGRTAESNGKTVVRMNLEFEGSPEGIIAPLSYLAIGLSKLSENQPPKDSLTIKTDESAIETEYDVRRFLTEKIVKTKKYMWKFHKSDPDPWSSRLHGHEYNKGLKLDAVTGQIYDVGTKQCCKKLKQKDLLLVQDRLRHSDDFRDKVRDLIDSRKPAKS